NWTISAGASLPHGLVTYLAELAQYQLHTARARRTWRAYEEKSQMKLSGEQTVPASREAVYDAMLDPETLKSALPGCEKLEEVGPNEYLATMTIGVAMIKGKYDGKVKITDDTRPEGFTMHIEGKGPQGQLSGVGNVRFEEINENETKVIYDG